MSSIRLCVPAAETLPAHVWERCHDLYGPTILDGVDNTERALRPGSSGRAVPGYQIKLVDPDGGVVGLAALATAEGGPDLSYGAVFLATAPVCASVAVMALLLPAPQEGQDESAAVRR